MRLPERQPLADEVIGEVGGRRVVLARGGAHALRAKRQRGQQRRQHAEDRLERVHRVEERLLVLLHVGVVREGQAFHRREDRDEIAVQAPALATHELGHVGILLLRHDRRAGGERIGELDEPEFRGRPQREIGGQTREVHACDGRGRQVFEDVVAVAHRVEAVRRHAAESQLARERLAIDRERRAGQRGGSEWQSVGAGRAAGEPLAVALEHEDVGEQVVREHDRLRALQVRVAGHRRRRRLARARDERCLHGAQAVASPRDRVLEVHPLVQRDLIVA